MFRHKRGKKETRYFVKWRDCSYEQATWEDETNIPPEAHADLSAHIDAYWSRLNDHADPNKKREKRGRKKDVRIVQKHSKILKKPFLTTCFSFGSV